MTGRLTAGPAALMQKSGTGNPKREAAPVEDCLHMVWLNLDHSRVVVEGRLQGACRGRHTLEGAAGHGCRG